MAEQGPARHHPDIAAVYCFNPRSGDEIVQAPSGACPAGYATFLSYNIPKEPGAPPISADPQRQITEGHAQPDEK